MSEEIEYIWMSMSSAYRVYSGDIQKAFNDGWEFYHGALRKIKEDNEQPRSNSN